MKALRTGVVVLGVALAISAVTQMNMTGVAPEEVKTTNMDAFYILQGSYIDAALEQAIEDHGSMESYIRDGLGLSDEDVSALKNQLLE